MKEPFPVLPTYDLAEDSTSSRWWNRPEVQDLVRAYRPLAHLEFTLKPAPMTVPGFNDLLNRFLAFLDPTNRKEFPRYFEKFDEEGGIGFTKFPDGLIHPDAKAFCYDVQQDNNIQRRTGIMIGNHSDQRSKIYGILRMADAFRVWLKREGILCTVYLYKNDVGEPVEIEPL